MIEVHIPLDAYLAALLVAFAAYAIRQFLKSERR